MNKKIFLIKLILISTLLISLSMHIYIINEDTNDYLILWTQFFITLISIIFFYYFQKLIHNKIPWISISNIFTIGYIITFFQMVILELFGFTIPGRFFYWLWANDIIIFYSFSISSIGLISFFLGTISFKKYSKIKSDKINVINFSNSFLIFLSYLFYLAFFLTSGSYKYGEYYAGDAIGINTHLYKLFVVSLSASIIVKISQLSANNYKNKINSFFNYSFYFGKPLLILLLWHICFSLFVGDRDQIIYFTLLFSGMYFMRFKKINIIKLILGIVILSITLSIVGEVRQSRYSGESYSQRIVNALNNTESSYKFDEKVPLSGTLELAMSIRTLNHAIYNVPEEYDYRYGLYQLRGIYSIIPGLSGVMDKILYDKEKQYYGSSAFITYLIQGAHPTYGDGTSILADIYLDFGLIGIIIILFLFGYFIQKNEYKLFYGYQYPSLLWVATLIFFAKSLYLSRSSLGLEFSNIVLIFILIKLNFFIVKKYKRRN